MDASRVALAWARVYTRGMPEPARRARLDELASDVFEQLDHAVADGGRRGVVRLAIAGRTARGAGADVAWRFSHRSRPVALTSARWAGWATFAGAMAFLLAFTSWSAAPVLGVYSVTDWAPGEAREFARVMSALFVALAAGLTLLGRLPRSGAALVAAACTGLCVSVLCIWPIFVPPALASTAGAVALARRRRGGTLGPTARRSIALAGGAGLTACALAIAVTLARLAARGPA